MENNNLNSDIGEDFIFKDLESNSTINNVLKEHKTKTPRLIQKLIDSGQSEMAIDNVVLVEFNNITSFMYAFGIRPGRLFKVTKVSTYKHQGKQKYNYTIYIPAVKQSITVKPSFIKEVEL